MNVLSGVFPSLKTTLLAFIEDSQELVLQLITQTISFSEARVTELREKPRQSLAYLPPFGRHKSTWLTGLSLVVQLVNTLRGRTEAGKPTGWQLKLVRNLIVFNSKKLHSS